MKKPAWFGAVEMIEIKKQRTVVVTLVSDAKRLSCGAALDRQ